LLACACAGYVAGKGEYEYLLGELPPEAAQPETPALPETLIVDPDSLNKADLHLWEEVKLHYGES
jgi:hypothetical protein